MIQEQAALEGHMTPGSLVRARGRDWVVLPSAEPDVLRLRPLAGGDEEGVGLFLPLEGREVVATTFGPPDPAQAGDATGSLLLRDAARLSLRAGAAPFRSLGRISVAPRPYQFVPLIMALRLDPVRLLIADDVGVGKTVEAAMIAREMLDRGLARRLAVICPAHLCDQWQRELHEKFTLEVVVVQPSTIGRLERNLPRADLSIYQYYPHLIVSIDWVKSERNRGRFLANAPDLVIVDEAHMAARPRGVADGTQHQRYEFLRLLADNVERHLVLVTATPHSGIEESFRSLLGLLNPAFDVAEQEAGGDAERRQLVPHIVQRRRGDLQHWLGATTPFPTRDSRERAYTLSAAYSALFEDVLDYCREAVAAPGAAQSRRQRVRHWAAIALLRCLLSSPDAAHAVLSGRAKRQGVTTEEPEATTADEIDALYRPQVLDPLDEEAVGDYTPTAPLEDADPHLSEGEKRKLAAFLKAARGLAGSQHDLKLESAARAVGEMLREGYRPIVFCRFIATANYLQEWLPRLLGREHPGLHVVAVTGEIGDEVRRARIEELSATPVRVLVATDCLSEGINLQEHFDAVLHYDLPWNPNRLEQREGRVDRFGQKRAEVRVELLHGADNPIDRVVLDVLIRKARTIRRHLGIAMPLPVDPEGVVQAVVDTVLLRGTGRGDGRGGQQLSLLPGATQLQLPFAEPEVSRLHAAWDRAAERESRQRAYFAQHGIKPDEVARELEAADPVLGDATTVQRFLANAAQRFGGALRQTARAGVFELDPGQMRHRLEERDITSNPVRLTFDRLKGDTELYVGRTAPLVVTYCDAVLGAALGPAPDERFARCGAIFTSAVA